MKRWLFIVILFVIFLALSFSAKAATLGEKRSFYIEPDYDFSGRKLLDAVLIKISDKAYFYADETWWKFSEQNKVLQSLDSLGEEFSNKIYPVLTSNFGSEWNPGIDNDSKITILLHPMIKEAGGYFAEKDEYSLFQNSSSNEKEMLYLNTEYIKTDYAKSLLAHDFVHLITFNQKNRKYGIQEDVWLNEARAEYAPTLLGYDREYEGSNLQKRVSVFTEKPSDSLVDWQGTKYDYGVVNLFVQYLVDNYGKQILIDSLMSKKVGIESIDYALAKNGFKDDFSQVFLNWIIAVYINDCNFGEKYCYKNQNLINLTVVPQINFLPLSGESTLTFADNLKNWSANWYKIVGGKENLRIKFEGNSSVFPKIPYILRNRSGGYLINFLTVDKTNKAEISIKDFGKDILSFTIIPLISNKNLPENLYYSFFWSAAVSQNNNDSEIIKQLLAQIEYLKKEISRLQGKNNKQNISCNSLNNNLYFGMKSKEVVCLQEFLKSQAEIYPEGLVTGFFGPLTKKAVIKFQEKYSSEILAPFGLQKGNGFVGRLTRIKINALLSSF